MTESAIFAAPWDQRLTTVTVVVSVLTLGTVAAVTWLALSLATSPAVRAVLVVSALVPLAAFALGALLGPRGYAIVDGRLRIERRVAPVEIPLASIRAVERVPDDAVSGALRTLGSGGFFGYYGRFRNATLGEFRMYATRASDFVLVRADRPYVLTPDAPAAFIEAVERARR